MVRYKLVEIKENIATYNYFVDEGSDPGIFTFNLNTKKFSRIKLSEDDLNAGDFEGYAKISILRKFKADNKAPESGYMVVY
ncbi:MAG: hypothetical protein PUB11_03910 [Oscillospiraceae bacterium]|nr:hypothetical protein [Oscillospiraceae bacterium]